MQPRDTLYRLATTAADYRACHRIMRLNERFQDCKLAWPTVVAERNGEIVGFMGSSPCDWCLMGGPMDMLHPNPIMAMRLIEAYENLLVHAGITRYCFYIGRTNKRWIEQVSAIDFVTQIGGDDHNIIFEKVLPGDPTITRMPEVAIETEVV